MVVARVVPCAFCPFSFSNPPGSQYKCRVQKKQAPSSEAVLSSGLRRYLYFTAATTGAVVLVIEILGAKMLSPYFGTSHFVWTAQIAVTLVSLAFGYYTGGWLVDRTPKLGRIYGSILLAAVYLCLSVLGVEAVAYRCLKFKLALGSLLASAFLFFVPLFLLAMVGPFFIRVLTVSVMGVGGNAGRLSAISTLGSVLGTVLIGYVLIPFLPNSQTMFITAGLLMALSAGYFFGWGRKERQQAGVAVGVATGLFFGWAGVSRDQRTQFQFGEQVFRSNSNFGQLQVLQDNSGERLYYLNDYLVQNTYDPGEKQSSSMFTFMLHDLTAAYAPRVEDVLCIGMGVGIVPMQFAREGSRVDVVEINPAVVPVAEKFFDFDSKKLNVIVGDGRYVVNSTEKKYDAVVLDAFLGDSSPSHLMTREAFASMRRVLRPDGVLVINSFGENEVAKDFFGASLEKTLRAVFRNVRTHLSGNGNVFLVATDQAEFKEFRAPNFEAMHPLVRHSARQAYAGIRAPDPKHGIVLTDDFNPVDFYDAGNREAIRRNLALSMAQGPERVD